jgi:hypothetical protein
MIWHVYAERGLKMISAEVIKGVQELLENRGVSPKADERFGDFVSRGLGISARQSEVLLQSLHDGDTVEEAIQAAEIDSNSVNGDLLVQIARAIGSALGRIAAQK